MIYKYKTEIENEIEIDLPYYFKIENSHIEDSYFAIISEKIGISNWLINDISVMNCPQILTRLIPKSRRITKTEFKTALSKSCNNIINLI